MTNERKSKARGCLLAVVLFLFIATTLLFVPFKTTVCPSWTLRVIDKQGNAVPYANVTQYWQYYSIEEKGHMDEICADVEGWVRFPKRTFSASAVSRIAGAVKAAKRLGIHASIGRDAYIIASGPGYDNHFLPYRGGEVPSSIMLTVQAQDEMFPYRKRCP